MNFLHYAILMFVICAGVLIAVSLFTPAQLRAKLAGLTFATVNEKLDTVVLPARTLARETKLERRANILLTGLLLATVIGLWIYFR